MAAGGTFRGKLARMQLGGVELDGSALNFAKPLIDPVLVNWEDVRLVRGDEPSIEWREHPRDQLAKPVDRPVAGCLQAFTRLAEATDEQIERFAQRWGVLGIWPRIHYEQMPIPGSKAHMPRAVYSEPTELWQATARRAEGMLLIAVALFDDAPASPGDWAKVLKPRHLAGWARRNGYSVAPRATGPDVLASVGADGQRELLARCIMQWLDQVCVTPVFRWNKDETLPRLHLDVNCQPDERPYGRLAKRHGTRSRVVEDSQKTRDLPFRLDCLTDYYLHRLRPSRLFNVIVLQLVAVISSPFGVHRCDVCGKPFAPRCRKPRADRQRLCENEECHAQAHRVHARKYARKRRAQSGS